MLTALAAGTAAPLVASLFPAELMAWGREVHAAADQGGSLAAPLPARIIETLAAACERIIPADDTPGAIAAGVPAFIDRMLAEWYEEPERARVIAGLQSLDAMSRGRHGRSFVDGPAADQDALLLELDREGPSHWFGTVKYLTIWGYYTSEVGVVRELRQGASPGRYDGCAPYTPRSRRGSAAP